MSSSSMNNRWLSVDEIAQHLGVGRNTVYRWITDRGMPAHRVGRLWKFQQDEVDAWIREGHASETDDAAKKNGDVNEEISSK